MEMMVSGLKQTSVISCVPNVNEQRNHTEHKHQHETIKAALMNILESVVWGNDNNFTDLSLLQC